MSDEKIDPPATAPTDAAAAAPAPRVHVGVGAVVEKGDGGRHVQGAPFTLPASRRCLATIPENLNDIWWRDCKVDQPVDGQNVQFITTDGAYHAGARLAKGQPGNLSTTDFYWCIEKELLDPATIWDNDQVTHWMPHPSKPK